MLSKLIYITKIQKAFGPFFYFRQTHIKSQLQSGAGGVFLMRLKGHLYQVIARRRQPPKQSALNYRELYLNRLLHFTAFLPIAIGTQRRGKKEKGLRLKLESLKTKNLKETIFSLQGWGKKIVSILKMGLNRRSVDDKTSCTTS